MDSFFDLYEIPQSFRPDAGAVKSKYYALSRQYHPDRFATAIAAQQAEALRKTALNNEAYKTLTDADRTMAYLLKLYGVLEEEEKYALPPAFLMEMMELNEAVGNAAIAPDMLPDAVREFQAAMAAWSQAVNPLVARFEAGDHSEALLKEVKDYYFRKKYLLRLQAQIEGA